jgi:hypothetical protein
MDRSYSFLSDPTAPLRVVSNSEKGEAGGYTDYLPLHELQERLVEVKQELIKVRVELQSFDDNTFRNRLLKRIENNGRHRRYGKEEVPTYDQLREEEEVMSRIAKLIRQEVILSSREETIINCINRIERNIG